MFNTTTDTSSWVAPSYGRSPDQVARGAWLKSLIEEHKAWLGLDESKPKTKALDYAAGTGLVSHVRPSNYC